MRKAIARTLYDDKKSMRIMTVLVTFINAACINLMVRHSIGLTEAFVWFICDVMYIGDLILMYRNRKIREAGAPVLRSIETKAKRLYLCGFSLDKYIDTCAFIRFGHWLDNGYCWVTAAIGMYLLIDNPSSKLCKGYCYNKLGKKSIHYWVEFQDQGWHWVLDLCWVGGLAAYEQFRRSYMPKKTWTCSYEDFWKIQITNRVFESMHHPDSSYVLDYLVSMYWNSAKNKGFNDEIEDIHMRDHTGMRYMIPVEHEYDIYRDVWADTLRDFVKNPKREQPKARTQRFAHYVVRSFNKFMATSSTKTPA